MRPILPRPTRKRVQPASVDAPENCNGLPIDQDHARKVTIFVPGGEIHISELLDTCPRKLLSRLRRALCRCGAKDMVGWFFGAIHGEYNPDTEMVRVHVHAVVNGGMIKAVQRLKKRRSYKPIIRAIDGVLKRVPRIRMTKKPLTDPPHALSYVLKSYWPSVWEGVIDGKIKRRNRPTRIPEPAHTRVLLWLDQYNLDDVTLLIGLRVGINGFELNKCTSKQRSDWKNLIQ